MYMYILSTYSVQDKFNDFMITQKEASLLHQI